MEIGLVKDLIVSFAVKPTSSILNSRKTIDKFGKNTSISVRGRHDPCVGIRAVPIGEAMMYCVLLDHYMMHFAQCKNLIGFFLIITFEFKQSKILFSIASASKPASLYIISGLLWSINLSGKIIDLNFKLLSNNFLSRKNWLT